MSVPLHLDLWPDGVPGLGPQPAPAAIRQSHPTDGLLLSAVHRPTLTIHPAPADCATGAAVLVCPGGGYRVLAVEKEGDAAAAWLNQRGIAAGVLHYRTHPNRHPAPLEDARRALSLLRNDAVERGVDSPRIGVLGFSAGGHLAAMLCNFPEETGVRPDFALLFYAVISLHLYAPGTTGSRDALLGPEPDPQLVNALSLETQVSPATPPTFLAHTIDDPAVPPEHARRYHAALAAAGVSCELHLQHSGLHGLGLTADHPAVHAWSTAATAWLVDRGLARAVNST